MERYIIREVGWMYDDSSYENGGLGAIVGTFGDLKEAVSYLKKWNRENLIESFCFFENYHFFNGEKEDFKKYIDGINDYLINELGFSLTLELYPIRRRNYSLSMFPKKPTDEQLDKLVDKINAQFFRIFKIEEGKEQFFNVKMNSDYAEYFEDYFGTNDYGNKYIYSSREEAVEKFNEEVFRYSRFRGEMNSHALLKQSLGALSNFPAILKSLIDESKFLEFDGDKLEILEGIGSRDLMKLNALLKKPFLLFEYIREDYGQIDEQRLGIIESTEKENISDWEEVEERSESYASQAELKRSIDYLLSYSFELPVYGEENNYFEIIKNNFSELFNLNVEKPGWGELKIGINKFKTHGVLVDYKKVNGVYHVESLFGLFGYSFWKSSKAGKGKGVELIRAFEMSLDDWFNKNEELIQEFMKDERYWKK